MDLFGIVYEVARILLSALAEIRSTTSHPACRSIVVFGEWLCLPMLLLSAVFLRWPVATVCLAFVNFPTGHWNPETLEPRVEAPGHWNLGTFEPRVKRGLPGAGAALFVEVLCKTDVYLFPPGGRCSSQS